MSKKPTRRQWTAVLTAAAAAPVAAQAPPGLVDQARQAVERNREVLTNYKVPMAVEPAFRFEA